MKKQFLDMLYSQRSLILSRVQTLNERDTFNGSVGSCDEPIWRSQVADAAERLEDIDSIITEYLSMHCD